MWCEIKVTKSYIFFYHSLHNFVQFSLAREHLSKTDLSSHFPGFVISLIDVFLCVHTRPQHGVVPRRRRYNWLQKRNFWWQLIRIDLQNILNEFFFGVKSVRSEPDKDEWVDGAGFCLSILGRQIVTGWECQWEWDDTTGTLIYFKRRRVES